MLDKYYKDSYFRLAIFVFIFMASQSFSLWFARQATSATHYAWPLLLFLYVSTGLILLFPTKTLKLARPLVPLIIFLSIWTLEVALSILPQNITPRAVLWPMSFVVISSVALILRHHTIVAWANFLMANMLVLRWYSDFYGAGTNLALFFFTPAVILGSAQVLISQVDVFQLKAEESEGLLKTAEDRSVKQQGVSFTAERRVKEVRALAEDMLKRIAFDPSPVTRTEIDDFRFAEAQLRDTIRGRYIVNDKILQATLAARQRGAKVDILDERNAPLPEHLSKLLTEAALEILQQVSQGEVTIRAFPKDDPTAVMVVFDGGNDEDSAQAIEISQEGQLERF